MIAKKNKKADLERKRFAFFQIGLILSGSLCLAAFEYSTASEEVAQTYKIEPPEIIIDLFTEPIIEPQQPTQAAAAIDLRRDITVVKEEVVITDPVIDPDPNEKIIITESIGDPVIGNPGTIIPEDDNTIYPISGVEPEFPGGTPAMAAYINDNIELPDYIADYDRGTMYVQFVVNKDGSIEQVQVVRGLSNELNKAAEKVVKKMPKWKPGEQAGKPVRVRFTLPIRI